MDAMEEKLKTNKENIKKNVGNSNSEVVYLPCENNSEKYINKFNGKPINSLEFIQTLKRYLEKISKGRKGEGRKVKDNMEFFNARKRSQVVTND